MKMNDEITSDIRRMNRDLFNSVKKLDYRNFWNEENFQRIFRRKYFQEKKLIKNNVDERRSEDVVVKNFIYGIVPEAILVSHFGYCFGEKYQDVIDPYGNLIEIKTTSRENNISKLLKSVNDNRHEKNRAVHLYIYVHEPKTSIYEMLRPYHWNGHSFA
jgi:hypothetical protein